MGLVISIMKARALTEEELKSLEGQSLDYLQENKRELGYFIFSVSSIKYHNSNFTHILDLVSPVHLLTTMYDQILISNNYGIPNGYFMSKPVFVDENKIKLIFINKYNHKITKTVTPVELNRYTTKKEMEYYIMYGEPVFSNTQNTNILPIPEYLPKDKHKRYFFELPQKAISKLVDNKILSKEDLKCNPGEKIIYQEFNSEIFKNELVGGY